MKVIASLIMVIALAWLARWLSADVLTLDAAPQIGAVMSVGLLMLGGWLSGKLFERMQLPGITGYLAFGILVGPFVLNLVAADQILPGVEGAVAPLGFISDLAIALIALTAGGEIHLSWLKGRTRKVMTVLAMHVIILMAFVSTFVILCHNYVPFLADINILTLSVVGLLTGVVMVASSPAVTIAMINDYKADGPLSQMTLVVTVFKDLVLIILFAIVMAVSKGLLDEQASLSGAFLIGVAFELLGSLGVGVVLGLLMALYVEKVGTHLIFFVVGSCLMIALLGEQTIHIPGMDHGVHLEPLLTALAAGMLMQNVWPEKSEPLFESIEATSLPVYCLFFALEAARIDLRVLGGLWMFSLALVAARTCSIWLSVFVGMKLAGLREAWSQKLWLGMISQAGVSLALVGLIAEGFAETPWALPMKETLIGAIFISQVLGPIGFRYALLSSGEGRKPDRN